MELLQISLFLVTPAQLCLNRFEGDSLIYHKDCQMVEQVRKFTHSVLLFSVFGSDNDLAALLPTFFQNLVQALFEQIASIGALRLFLTPAFYGLIKFLQNIHLHHSPFSEASPRSFL